MKNSKSTIIGIVVAILLAAWGIFQPALTGGKMDLKILIPAVIIAIVGILEKDLGSWKTTSIGIILASVVAAAGAYQSHPNQWVTVIGAILTTVGFYLVPDKNSSDNLPVNNDMKSDIDKIGEKKAA